MEIQYDCRKVIMTDEVSEGKFRVKLVSMSVLI